MWLDGVFKRTASSFQPLSRIAPEPTGTRVVAMQLDVPPGSMITLPARPALPGFFSDAHWHLWIHFQLRSKGNNRPALWPERDSSGVAFCPALSPWLLSASSVQPNLFLYQWLTGSVQSRQHPRALRYSRSLRTPSRHGETQISLICSLIDVLGGCKLLHDLTLLIPGQLVPTMRKFFGTEQTGLSHLNLGFLFIA